MKNETFLHDEQTQELTKLLAQNCESLSDVQSLLKNLFKGTLEEMLESEMDDHLGYDKYSSKGIMLLPLKIVQNQTGYFVHEQTNFVSRHMPGLCPGTRGLSPGFPERVIKRAIFRI